MIENLKMILQQETLAQRSQRMIPAAIYGASIGTVYTVTLSLINVFTFPELPIGMDWEKLLGLWLGYSLAFALFGAVAAWFTEEYAGTVGGGVIITILLGIFFLVSSHPTNTTLTAQSIITVLPLIGVCMLVAMGLRWTARRQLEIMHEARSKQRRKLLARHVVIIILVGLVPGIFNRMDLPAEQSLTQLHELLQAAPNDSSGWPQLPLRQVPALKDHFGVEYLLYPSRSVMVVGSLDVTVKFADGFMMICVLPVSTRSNFITDCVEGDDLKASAQEF